MDVFSKAERSRIMSKVRSINTKPEIAVRRILHRLGFRFRLHSRVLPGHPDIVLPKYRLVVFVHGCFWHGHPHCERASLPATNISFWKRKITRNAIRDKKNIRKLHSLGWRTIHVWECRISDERGRASLAKRFAKLVHSKDSPHHIRGARSKFIHS